MAVDFVGYIPVDSGFVHQSPQFCNCFLIQMLQFLEQWSTSRMPQLSCFQRFLRFPSFGLFPLLFLFLFCFCFLFVLCFPFVVYYPWDYIAGAWYHFRLKRVASTKVRFCNTTWKCWAQSEIDTKPHRKLFPQYQPIGFPGFVQSVRDMLVDWHFAVKV